MPIKLLGAGLIFLSGMMWGMYKAKILADRERSLKSIITALGMLESEILFSSNRLKTALLSIADMSSCRNLFKEAADKMEDESVFNAWTQAVNKVKKEMCLTEKDAEIVGLLGAELGKSDKEQQIRNIRHVTALLNTAALEAHGEYLTSAKMYRSLGISGGLFLAILLM